MSLFAALFVASVVAMEVTLPAAMTPPIRTLSAMRKSAPVAIVRIIAAIDPATKAAGTAEPRTCT